jgi:hypothetical protein
VSWGGGGFLEEEEGKRWMETFGVRMGETLFKKRKERGK